jgi:hypothetical protein
MATISESKSSWQTRARDGLRKTTEFVAEHGSAVGLGGGSILLAAGIGMSLSGDAFGNQENMALFEDSARQLLMAGVIKLGGCYAAEKAARLYLKGTDYLFDDADYKKAAYGGDGEPIYVDSRSGSAIKTPSDDVILADPAFQRAIQSVFKDLEKDPETRHSVYQMLANNPEARQALVNAQKNIEANPQAKNKVIEEIDMNNIDLPDDEFPSV